MDGLVLIIPHVWGDCVNSTCLFTLYGLLMMLMVLPSCFRKVIEAQMALLLHKMICCWNLKNFLWSLFHLGVIPFMWYSSMRMSSKVCSCPHAVTVCDVVPGEGGTSELPHDDVGFLGDWAALSHWIADSGVGDGMCCCNMSGGYLDLARNGRSGGITLWGSYAGYVRSWGGSAVEHFSHWDWVWVTGGQRILCRCLIIGGILFRRLCLRGGIFFCCSHSWCTSGYRQGDAGSILFRGSVGLLFSSWFS